MFFLGDSEIEAADLACDRATNFFFPFHPDNPIYGPHLHRTT